METKIRLDIALIPVFILLGIIFFCAVLEYLKRTSRYLEVEKTKLLDNEYNNYKPIIITV
jgi:hypothetical protein